MSHDDSPGPNALQYGVYQHYKGRRYLILGVARDHLTDDLLVVYARLYGREGIPISVQPLDRFLGHVVVDGELVPRFQHIGVAEHDSK